MFANTTYEENTKLEKFVKNERAKFSEIPSSNAAPAKCFDFQVEKTKTDEALAQLHQLGILNFDNFNISQLKYLKFSNPLIRDIKLLDKMNRYINLNKISRETIKVSILYIGPFSENEQDVLLQTANTSLDYREFVQSLGWTVRKL
jgi:hypothetical protein